MTGQSNGKGCGGRRWDEPDENRPPTRNNLEKLLQTMIGHHAKAMDYGLTHWYFVYLGFRPAPCSSTNRNSFHKVTPFQPQALVFALAGLATNHEIHGGKDAFHTGIAQGKATGLQYFLRLDGALGSNPE